jgi:hypothetical protein
MLASPLAAISSASIRAVALARDLLFGGTPAGIPDHRGGRVKQPVQQSS